MVTRKLEYLADDGVLWVGIMVEPTDEQPQVDVFVYSYFVAQGGQHVLLGGSLRGVARHLGQNHLGAIRGNIPEAVLEALAREACAAEPARAP